jgi:hypothetical protein
MAPVEVFDVAAGVELGGATVWAGTREGLYRWVGGAWEQHAATAGVPVRVVEVDAMGVVWCVADGDVGRPPVLLAIADFDGAPSDFPLPSRHNLAVARALLALGPGEWWLGTTQGVLFFDGNWSTPAAPPGQPETNGFARAPDGSAWVATASGLYQYTGSWSRFGAADGLPSDVVQSVFVDPSGPVWAGTRDGAAFSDDSWRRYAGVPGLGSAAVEALAAGLDGSLWVATRDGLAQLQDGRWRAFSTEDGLPSHDIRALALDADGRLWAGAAVLGGLARPAEDGWSALRAVDWGGDSNEVHSLLFDSAGRLWVGTGTLRVEQEQVIFDLLGGIARLDDSGWTFFRTGSTPVALAEDGGGAVWAATLTRGLVRFDGAGFTSSANPVGARVQALLGDAHGDLWAGTPEGLFRWDGFEWREIALLAAGLGNSVHSLFEDNEGHLWVGLDEGAARWDGAGAWLRFGTADGLPDRAVSAIVQTAAGDHWFGGLRQPGLAVHRASRTAPQTRLTVAPRGTVGEAAVLIAFEGGGPDTPPDQMRYAHRVNDGPWSPPQFRTEVFLTDLPNLSTVRVEVRAVDRDGNADPTPALAQFHVDTAPPAAEITSPAAGEPVSGVVAVRGRAFDATDFDRYRLDLGAGQAVERATAVRDGILGTWDTRSLADGEHTLHLTVWDRLDGPYDVVHKQEWAVTVRIDNAPPVGRLTFPPDPLTGLVELVADLADDYLQGYRLDYTQRADPSAGDWRRIDVGQVPGPAARVAVVWDTSAVDGPALVRLQVFDRAGNAFEVVHAALLSNRAARPFVQVVAPLEGQVIGGVVSVVATVTDSTLVRYVVEVTTADSGRWRLLAQGTAPADRASVATWETTTALDGEQMLRVRAYDDNDYETSVSVRVVVDNTPPTVAIRSPALGQQVAGVVSVAGSATDAHLLHYRVEWARASEPGRWIPLTGAVPTPIDNGTLGVWDTTGAEGRALVRVTAEDVAGNSAHADTAVVIAAPVERSRAAVVQSADRRAQLRIAPNALSSAVALTINGVDVSGADGRTVVAAYALEPADVVFDSRKPATLEIALPESFAGDGRDLHLAIWDPDERRWHPLGGTVEAPGRWLRARVGRLGTYAVIAGGSPHAAVSDGELRLRCQPRALAPRGGSALPQETTISFAVAREGTTRVRVFNAAGRLVRRLVEDSLRPGEQAFLWNGRDDSGTFLPNGPYVVSVETGVSRGHVVVLIWNP